MICTVHKYFESDYVKNEMGGMYSTHGEVWYIYKIVVGNTERKRQVGRPRCKWEDNIKVDICGIVYECVNWVQLVQDKAHWQLFVKVLMNV